MKVVFFGATGGCTLACLVRCLQAGYTCVALVRTPSKLQTLLTQNGIPTTLQDALLTIIAGDVTDATAVQQALTVSTLVPDTPISPPDTTSGPQPAPDGTDLIISGLGGAPSIGLSGATLDQPSICTDGISTVLSTLRRLRQLQPDTKKPYLAAISSTGLDPAHRDIPLLMVPLYRWLLAAPHVDKRNMEACVRDEMARADGDRVLRGAVLVRPSFFTDGKVLGVKSVRVGTVEDPAVGYSVSRGDVGGWVFEEVVGRYPEGVADGLRVVNITY